MSLHITRNQLVPIKDICWTQVSWGYYLLIAHLVISQFHKLQCLYQLVKLTLQQTPRKRTYRGQFHPLLNLTIFCSCQNFTFSDQCTASVHVGSGWRLTVECLSTLILPSGYIPLQMGQPQLPAPFSWLPGWAHSAQLGGTAGQDKQTSLL